ncbi:flavin reductase [Glaciimonas sp. PCH181]|uniref:flavin reductase n=1 Tax=Glaciimonas sp. PCH181 TaxID=2133943 RepID=UPI000D3B32FF|nr:flavin reductase [Glaciimonas sp. PCH181]PUA20446.1 monooxygenase [Glaciimonas sp. PCH181]
MQILNPARQIDGARFREVLGSYPTGVAIVTCMDENGLATGMVIGSFTSVSLDPPLIAYLPMKTSRTFARMSGSSTFCVNILAADQETICQHFASQVEDKFAGIAWHPSPAGNPVLDGVVAWIDCDYASVTEVGDHYIVLGGALDMQLERDTAPLLFFQRGYGRFSPGPLVAAAERETIQAVRLAEMGRDEMEAVATELNAECSIIAAVGGDVVYVAVENCSPHWRLRSRLGFRVPCAPPLGPLFVGNPGAPADSEWLKRLSRPDQETIDSSLAQLERVRSRGWSISLQGPNDDENLDEMVALYSNPHRTPGQERRLLAAAKERASLHEPDELLEDVAYDVRHLSVPVHDASGHVLLVLRLSAVPPRADMHQIRQWLERLQQSAARLEKTIASRREQLRV